MKRSAFIIIAIFLLANRVHADDRGTAPVAVEDAGSSDAISQDSSQQDEAPSQTETTPVPTSIVVIPAEQTHIAPAWNVTPAPDSQGRGLSLGGPRFGGTYIAGAGFSKLKPDAEEVSPGTNLQPFVTDFGWQFEYHIMKTSQGLTALTEIIPLIGGLEQGLVLPSVDWIVGVRTKSGFEMGVGPNVGLGGVSLLEVVGYTWNLGGINFPLDLALGQASQTNSISLSVGFNL